MFSNRTYHPIRVTSSTFTKAGTPIHPIIDETCPHCYPEKAAAEQEERREAREKKAIIEEMKVEEEKREVNCMIADMTPCMDDFALNLS